MGDTEAAIQILVVDDDAFTAEMTALTLESSGYDVIIAEGGMDAMEKISEHESLRMVISDMNMPFIDGAQLFEELRRSGYRQPFVLLTGDDAEPLKTIYPAMDAILSKDEHLQDILPQLVCDLLAGKSS